MEARDHMGHGLEHLRRRGHRHGPATRLASQPASCLLAHVAFSRPLDILLATDHGEIPHLPQETTHRCLQGAREDRRRAREEVLQQEEDRRDHFKSHSIPKRSLKMVCLLSLYKKIS